MPTSGLVTAAFMLGLAIAPVAGAAVGTSEACVIMLRNSRRGVDLANALLIRPYVRCGLLFHLVADRARNGLKHLTAAALHAIRDFPPHAMQNAIGADRATC